MKSQNLHAARMAKNDEFYTQYCDIEKECSNYLGHFFDKVIYCNCDTGTSNFVKYFQGLKKRGLIKDVIHSGGLDGLDFRSRKSIELLKKADIVISNPPFSLFREYVAQLIQYDKLFLIIGNQNAVAYKQVFDFISKDKIWHGYNHVKKFVKPNGEIQNFGNICWFTNLDVKKKNFDFNPRNRYSINQNLYPKYENLDAININRLKEMPIDYNGIMGVPITFIDKYNPNEFVILGLDKQLTCDGKGVRINGRNLYTRIIVQRKQAANDNQNLTLKAA